MQMSGPLGIRDYSPYLARDGLFEFTEIMFEPVATPDPPEWATAGSDLDIPPLHMISTESGEYWTEKETWYFDGRTMRETIIDAADPSHIGGFTFAVDDQSGTCFPGEGFCEVEEFPDGETYELFSQVPEELVAENCAEATADTVADRSARHYVCDSLWFDGDDGWRASTDASAGIFEFWYDTETGLRLKVLRETWSWEVTLLEINPQFPPGIFEYEEPDWAEPPSGLAVGDVAPPWSGPLVGGGTFDMADQARKYVVVYSWVPYCGTTCLDYLMEFQLLFEDHATETLVFVTVSEDTPAETERVLDRMGISVPSVYCYADPDPETHAQPTLCLPETPGFLWGSSLIVIDPDGVAVAVFAELPFDGELEQLLGDISS